MKKFFKRFIAILVATFMMLSTSMTTFAENNVNLYETVEFDGIEMYLICEEIITNDECTITNRLYSTVNPKTRGAIGNGTFRNEKEEEYVNYTLRYWVQGDFEWNEDNNTAIVYNATVGHNYPNGITISESNVDYGSNQGGVWPGKKYAYVSYSLTATNPIGLDKYLDAYIDVNVLGEVTYR